MRKRYLFTVLPTNDLGLLTRSLPVARALQKKGHAVVFSHPAKAPRKLIADAGFENLVPIHPLYEIGFNDLHWKDIFSASVVRDHHNGAFSFLKELIKTIPYRAASFNGDVWDMDHAFAITGCLNTNFVKAQCEVYMNVIRAAAADAVVDFWNPFACIAARKLGVPLITINQGDALPAGKGFAWWKKKPEGIPSVVPAVNKVLRSYGLKEVKKVEEVTAGDLSLVTGMPETDPLTGDHHYVGPLLWQDPTASKPAWLQNIPDDKPLIWMYTSNPSYKGRSKIFDSNKMLQPCFDALANEDYYVVVSTGHHPLPKTVNVPSNFMRMPYVPGLFMAESSDLLIHHGGYGSCQTSLYCGTPSLIFPTFSERESNARRLKALGAAEFILPGAYDAENIRMKVKQLLNNPSYSMAAATYGQQLKSFGGIAKAVELIEKFTTAPVANGLLQIK